MTKIKTFVICFLFFSFLSCNEQAQENELKKVNLWEDQTDTYLPVTQEWTNRVEVADINGDQMLDLLFANGGNYSEPGDFEISRVFINRGPGKRMKEISSDIFGEKKFLSRVIKVRDVNNDRIPDIIVGTTYQTQSQLYLGLGKGKFKDVTKSHFPDFKASIGDLELGDVDDDGDLDIVLADWGPGSNMNNSGGRTILWLNNGKGKFKDATFDQMPEVLVQFSWDLEFFDFDNDFDLDIAISCKRCPTSRIFVNDGEGHFKDSRRLPAYTNNYDLEIMDLNQDGFLDLVTVNDGDIVAGENSSRREHIFINDQGEKFIDKTDSLWPDSENIGKDDNNIVFLDYDSDGDPDFLISSLTGEDRLLVNDGNGKFSLLQPVLKGKPTPLTLSLAVADINNDQKLDVIMGQGEGEEGIEERIFIAKDLAPDTSAPVISHEKILKNANGTFTIKARIHDNKSPNMPHDWKEVVLRSNQTSQPVQMLWYGENLWKATFSGTFAKGQIQLCATDASDNINCKDIQLFKEDP